MQHPNNSALYTGRDKEENWVIRGYFYADNASGAQQSTRPHTVDQRMDVNHGRLQLVIRREKISYHPN